MMQPTMKPPAGLRPSDGVLAHECQPLPFRHPCECLCACRSLVSNSWLCTPERCQDEVVGIALRSIARVGATSQHAPRA